MTRFVERFKVESSRLTGWDYSEKGYYFVTICTRYHGNFLGKIVEGELKYNESGKICVKELLKTFETRKYLKLIAWVVMPNHVHVLFSIGDNQVETPGLASLPGDFKETTVISNYRNHPEFFNKLNLKSNQEVPKLVRAFKSAVKREANKEKLFFVWQERYYDEIIQDENKLKIIIYYIKNNINNWEKDKLFSKT